MDEIILSDDQAMALAIEEGKKGWGRVSPNPAVGCVILDKNNHLLSKGFHQKYGDSHAEINALKLLPEEKLEGARVFVTLEPCSHYGKTPPCAEALARLPIKEVIYGLQDPNPLVAGKGLEILRRAGIGVQHYNQKQNKLEELCEHFLKNMRHHRPFFSLKAAVSIDGQLALKNGKSQWITGDESRLESHFLRARHDSILVGVKTFLMDNPSLTIRHQDFPLKTLKVLVIDPDGRGLEFLGKSKLIQSHIPQNIYWITKTNIDEKAISIIQKLNINFIGIESMSSTPNELNLSQLSDELWKLKIHSVLVEGGGATLSAFLNQKIGDRLYLFMAPIIIGENNGVSWVPQLTSIESLTQCFKLREMEISSKGQDLLLSARFL